MRSSSSGVESNSPGILLLAWSAETNPLPLPADAEISHSFPIYRESGTNGGVREHGCGWIRRAGERGRGLFSPGRLQGRPASTKRWAKEYGEHRGLIHTPFIVYEGMEMARARVNQDQHCTALLFSRRGTTTPGRSIVTGPAQPPDRVRPASMPNGLASPNNRSNQVLHRQAE